MAEEGYTCDHPAWSTSHLPYCEELLHDLLTSSATSAHSETLDKPSVKTFLDREDTHKLSNENVAILK